MGLRRQTQAQVEREYSLTRQRYADGYNQFYKDYYVENADKIKERYELIVKPKLALPEVKEHINNLQRLRRDAKRKQREQLRKSMPFTEYKKLLAEKKQNKERKKEGIQIAKEAIAFVGSLKKWAQKVDSGVEKIKLTRSIKELKAQAQLSIDLNFVLNKKNIYKKVTNRIRRHRTKIDYEQYQHDGMQNAA